MGGAREDLEKNIGWQINGTHLNKENKWDPFE
jgi:hypothetical protein